MELSSVPTKYRPEVVKVAKMKYGILTLVLLVSAGVLWAQTGGMGTGDSVNHAGQRGHWNLTDEQRTALDQKMKELKEQNATREEIKAAMRDLLKGYGIDIGNAVNKSGKGHRMGPPPFMEPLVLGHGFALKESDGKGLEYHTLHIDIVKAGKFPPGRVHSFLAQNKTPEEIAKKFQEENKTREARAHLRFAGTPYALNITSQENDSVEGDIMNLPSLEKGIPPEGFVQGEIVGHASLKIADYEGEKVITGSITINGEEYDVLLTSPHPGKFGAQGPGQRVPWGKGAPPGEMMKRRNASIATNPPA